MPLHVQRQEMGVTEVSRHKRTTASGKTTTVRQHHRDTGSGGARERPERFLLTVRSRSGRRINAVTGAPEDTVMVHGREDLERRIRAAEQDPDLEVSYRDDRPPPPQASSLKAGDRPEPDWSWLDGDRKPAGDFWADDED